MSSIISARPDFREEQSLLPEPDIKQSLASVSYSLVPDMSLKFNIGTEDWGEAFMPDPDVQRESNEIQTKLIRITRPFRIRWDLFTMLLALYNCVTVPLAFSFNTAENETVLAINTLFDCIFMVDVVLNFFTTFIDSNGDEVVDQRTIALNYLKLMFWVDFLSSVPIDNFADSMFNQSDVSKVLMMSDLVKLIRILRLTRIIRFLRARDQTKYVIKLMTLLMYLFIWIHLASCFYFALARTHEDWIPVPDFANGVQDIYDKSLLDQYVIAFYHGVWMLKGNELGPTDTDMAAYGGFIMILGALITAILFGELAVIVSSFSRKQTIFQELLETSITTMQKLEIPAPLKMKVLEYISTTYASISAQEEYESFMRYISPSLAREVRRVLYEPIMSANCIMATEPTQISAFMLQNLEQQFVKPEQEIIVQGSEAEGFYFIVMGECTVYVTDEQNNKNLVCYLNRGSHFGEISLLYDTLTTASVESKEYSTVAKLSPEIFTELLNRHPSLANKFRKNTQKYEDDFKSFLLDGIGQANYFSFLPPDSFQELAYWMKPQVYEPGEYLFKPSDPVDCMYFISEGILELSFTFNDRFISLLKDRQNIEEITPYMMAKSLSEYNIQAFDISKCERLKPKAEIVPLEQNYRLVGSIFNHETTPVGFFRLGEFMQEVIIQHVTPGTLMCSKLVLMNEVHYLQCKVVTNAKVYKLPANLIFSLCEEHKSYQQQLAFLRSGLVKVKEGKEVKLYGPIDILEGRINHHRIRWKSAICAVIVNLRNARSSDGHRLVKLIPKIKAILACEKVGNYDLAQRVIKGEIPAHLITEEGMLDPSASRLSKSSIIVTRTHPVMALIRKMYDDVMLPNGSIYRMITSLERIAKSQNRNFEKLNFDLKKQKQLLLKVLKKLDPNCPFQSQSLTVDEGLDVYGSEEASPLWASLEQFASYG
mmetsp:Transcript_8148/g.16048  ORF Transcript_8148/g.16048 Transcript_8148/m.16048 type:complete len:936 (-) Transcript_8148:1060-3867(-)